MDNFRRKLKGNTGTNLNETGKDDVNLIHLAQERDVVNTVIKLPVP